MKCVIATYYREITIGFEIPLANSISHWHLDREEEAEIDELFNRLSQFIDIVIFDKNPIIYKGGTRYSIANSKEYNEDVRAGETMVWVKLWSEL